MNHFTRVLLVLLRLAIGWQILVEGVEKLGTLEIGTIRVAGTDIGNASLHFGPAEGKKPWTSEAYLREANGPLRCVFQNYVLGDPRYGGPDEVLIKHLKVEDNALPAPLEEEWDYYLQRFTDHYGLDPQQAARARGIVAQRKAQALRSLNGAEKKTVKKTFPSGTVEVEQTMPQRLADFEAKLAEIKELEQAQRSMDHDVAKDKLVKAKADAARMRAGLQDDLNDLTEGMKKALQGGMEGKDAKSAPPEELLTKEQRDAGPVPEPTRPREGDWLDWAVDSRFGFQDRTVAKPLVPLSVRHIDAITKWGLTVIGLGLLLGLFTRTACLGGVFFLVLFYLAMPPFPWLAAAPNNEGHYLFVNKTLIEAIALLTLATTRSGKWFGLDALVQFLSPWRWRKRRRLTLDNISGRPPVGNVVTVSRSNRPVNR